jgi:hypothetical protein
MKHKIKHQMFRALVASVLLSFEISPFQQEESFISSISAAALRSTVQTEYWGVGMSWGGGTRL